MSNAFPAMMSTQFAYQPCPGLLTGGKVFRNSFCWRSASLCSSASRACCSGLGPEPAQPSNAISNVEIKSDAVNSFFIRDSNRTIIDAIKAATSRQDPPRVGEAGLFDFGDVVFVYCLLAVLPLECFQALKDLIQRELILQIHLIIDFRPQPVFIRLPVLRH